MIEHPTLRTQASVLLKIDVVFFLFALSTPPYANVDASALPGHWGSVVKVTAGRAVIGERGEFNNAFGGLFDRPVAGVGIEVGVGVARIGGIHFDARLGQLFREYEHRAVERVLGRIVAKKVEAVVRVGGVGEPAQGSQPATDHYDVSVL
jgi:hypothetical protein